MYKLVGTDFDGTLLNDDRKITDTNIEGLKEAKENNIVVVAVTGRTLNGVKDAVDINLFDYLILNNGVNIFDVKENRLIYNKYIDKDIAREITEFTEECSKQLNYCTYSSYKVYKNFKDRKIPFVKEVKSIEEVTDPISKINIYLNRGESIELIHKKIKDKFRNTKTIIMQDSANDKRWLIVTPKNIDKKEALEFLGNYLKITLSEMVFFGDGLNDLEVMESVGMGVAMGNALDEVLQRAKDTTLSNNDSGVAYYIKKKILKR